GAGRRLPHAALAVDAGVEPGHRAAVRHRPRAKVAQRVGDVDAREVERGVVVAERRAVVVEPVLDLVDLVDAFGDVDDHEGAAAFAVGKGFGEDGRRVGQGGGAGD